MDNLNQCNAQIDPIATYKKTQLKKIVLTHG